MLGASKNPVSQLHCDDKFQNEAKIESSSQFFNTLKLTIPSTIVANEPDPLQIDKFKLLKVKRRIVANAPMKTYKKRKPKKLTTVKTFISPRSVCEPVYGEVEGNVQAAAEETANKPDPLKIEEYEEPKDQLPQVKRSATSHAPLKTYSKKQPQLLKRLKSIVPEETLRTMVYEVLESVRSFTGARPRDISGLLLSKYDVNVDCSQIRGVLQDGVTSGEILQIKREGKTPTLRFKLSKLHPKGGKRLPENIKKPAASSSAAKKTDVIENTEAKNVQESKLNDANTQLIDPEFIKCEVISEGESSSFLGNEEPVDASKLETRGQNKDGDPIYANEIDFMVLHSLYSSTHTDGMRIDDIAEFINSFYGVDVPESLPRIERYLNYSVEKGVLMKNGDRYKNTVAISKADLEGKIASPELLKDRSSCTGKKFFLTEFKLEPEEAENFLNSRLATDRDKVEIIVDNNVLRSIGETPEPKIVKTFKIKKKNFITAEDISHFETIQKWAAQKSVKHSQIKPYPTKLKNKRRIAPKIIKPSIPCKSVEVIPAPFENIEPFPEQRRNTRIFSDLNDAFQSPTYHKHNLSVFQITERADLQNQKAQGNYNLKIKPSGKHGRRPAVKFGLGFVIDYLSQHPLPVLENPATSTGNLSWKEIALTKDSFCLKLTGECTPSSEALNCEVCGLQLTFGPLNCPVCSFELKNFIEKCEICDLICNREDVFLKHFHWDHSPSFQGEDDDGSLSVAEENIVRMLDKLRDGDLFHCRLCMYLSNDIKAFDIHIVFAHTRRINVFPPLPEVDDLDKVGIFRNEISSTCCYKCMVCGFISNRRDFIVYHMLEVHIVVDKENYEEFLWNLETEDMKRHQPVISKPNYNFGLCPHCGKFFNNVNAHLATHRGERNKTLDSIKEGETSSSADATLQKPQKVPRKKRARLITTDQFLCHVCGLLMTRRLNEHLRRHNNEMYPCTICGKEFNRESNLLTHKRVHTREKPFQCDICKMRFGYKCSVKGHIINVHSETTR